MHDDEGFERQLEFLRVSGNPALKVKSFPWWMMPFVSPFVPFLRELREMCYLWKELLRMPNDRLVAAIGAEPWTPIDEAVCTSLAGLGCLPLDGTNTQLSQPVSLQAGAGGVTA